MAGTEYEKAAIGGPVTRCEPGPCGRDKQMIEVRAAPEASFAVNVAVIETNARTEGPGDPSHAPRWRVSQREAAFERRKQLAGSRDETKRAKPPFDTNSREKAYASRVPNCRTIDPRHCDSAAGMGIGASRTNAHYRPRHGYS